MSQYALPAWSLYDVFILLALPLWLGPFYLGLQVSDSCSTSEMGVHMCLCVQ